MQKGSYAPTDESLEESIQKRNLIEQDILKTQNELKRLTDLLAEDCKIGEKNRLIIKNQEEIKEQLKQECNELEEKKRKIIEEIDGLKKEVISKNKINKEVNNSINALSKEIVNLRKEKDAIVEEIRASVQKKVNEIGILHDMLRRREGATKEVEELDRIIEEKKKEEKEKQDQVTFLEQKKSTINEKCNNLLTQVEQKKKELKEIDADAKVTQGYLNDLYRKTEGIKANIKLEEQKLKQLKKESEIYAAAEQRLEQKRITLESQEKAKKIEALTHLNV